MIKLLFTKHDCLTAQLQFSFHCFVFIHSLKNLFKMGGTRWWQCFRLHFCWALVIAAKKQQNELPFVRIFSLPLRCWMHQESTLSYYRLGRAAEWLKVKKLQTTTTGPDTSSTHGASRTRKSAAPSPGSTETDGAALKSEIKSVQDIWTKYLLFYDYCLFVIIYSSLIGFFFW